MLNIHARAAVSRVVDPIGHALAGIGVTPDAVTLVGTLGTVTCAVLLFGNGAFVVGALLITVFVLLDMVDGAVARAGGRGSVFGAVLDSSCDRISDAAIFAAVGWYYAGRGERAMLLAALLCLILGTLTSYLRARAEGAGLTASVGIAERPERLILVLVGTFFSGLGVPYILAIALWLLVAASAITVGQRFATVWVQAGRSAAQTPAAHTPAAHTPAAQTPAAQGPTVSEHPVDA